MKLIKSLITVSVLVMFAILLSLTAFAANYSYNISTGDIIISAGTGSNAGKIAISQGTARYINSSDTITITGSTTTNTIKVEPGVTDVKIILSNVSIDVSASGDDPRYSKCAFDIGDGSVVELTLNAGTTNTFKSGVTKAGIKVETSEAGIAGSITINGTGTIIAIGGSGGPANWASGSGAGIGSNGLIYTATTVPSGGNITINSGTINATGGIGSFFSGAGIGGGGGQSYFHSEVVSESNAPNAGNITIHGGIVTATGGSNQFSGAGIGGGSGQNSGTMGTVLIDGGTVTARSGNGTYIANGIGYGYSNSSNLVRTETASITITGNAVVNASSSNGTRVYAAIGHNGNQSITISGTATVMATKGVQSSPYYSDCGTISCNNLTISDSPSITVYSQNKQGDQSYLDNAGHNRAPIRPIYANSITSSVPLIAGIFPSAPNTNTIVLTGGEPSSSKTITLPASYASFATTVGSTGTYAGSMGIDVLQNTATSAQTFNLTNAVSTFNVKQLDITPPAAPGGLTAAAGPIINSQEESDGVQVVLSLGTSGALVNDVAELLVGGQAFSSPVKYVLTAADISANSCTITIPATRLGADGNKSIAARVIDEAGNIGPAGKSITLVLDTVPPTAPTAVTVTSIGGTTVSNTLNLTNTNLTASALIIANEATGGSAKLYINGILKATDDTILAEDTQVTFDLGQSTTSGLQAAVETGGVVTIELYNAIGNKSVSSVDNPTLEVDYTAPQIVTVEVPTPKSYKTGQNLDFTVNFNEAVTVTSETEDKKPYIKITLDTGGTVNAYYESSSGSALTFRYTVADGDNDSNGIQVSSVPVALNGGSIRDAAGNNADLTLYGVEDTDKILVDTTAPRVVSVGAPTFKTYISKQDLIFTVNFDEKVTVTNGIPFIPITLDIGGTVNASYISGSGSNALTFSYPIQPGNSDSNGIEIGTLIDLNNLSIIKDIAGNNAELELNDVDTTGVKIDAVLPTIISAVLAPNNAYVDITFSKGIGALASDKLALTFTKNDGSATGASITAIKANDNEIEGSSSALTGGETTIRVFINIVDTPSGLETIEIKPSNATSVYDVVGNPMSENETSGVITLRDKIFPTVEGGTIEVSDLTSNSAKLAWSVASDAVTLPANLKYKVVYSTSTISSVTDADILSDTWIPNITTATVTGLTANTDYYFYVLVMDEAENKALYTAATGKTMVAAYGGGDTTSNSAIVVNGQAQDAGMSATSTNASGQRVTTVTVDDSKLDKILHSSGEKPTVTLPSTGSDVTVGELGGQTIKNMEQKEATLEIKTETVTYTLPASEINIEDVSEQLGSQVALKDIKVSVSIAEPLADTVKIVEDTANKNSYQLVVKPIEFKITCTSGDKTVEVSKFNGYVERTIAIPDGIDPSKITTGIVLNADGTFSHVPTTIVQINGKYYAKIKSLTNSTYSVIYNPVTFTDVASHWAKDAINDMGSRMIVTGVGCSTYEPDRSITRAEFAAVVVRAVGLKKGTTESTFGDVTLTDWFNGYVDTATTYSLITGYDSTIYGPNDTITREQAMAILARAMKLTGLSVSLTDSEVSTLLANYTDGASVSSYAKESAVACIKAGIVTGSSSTTISPKACVTRAEVAVMVQRLLQKSGLV